MPVSKRKLLAMLLAEDGSPLLPISATAIVELQAAEGDQQGPPKVTATAYTGGTLSVGSYPHPMVVDLDGLDFSRSVPLLSEHDRQKVVGQGKAARDGNKLLLSGLLQGSNAAREEIIALARDGYVWSLSVGVAPSRIENVPAGRRVTVNGQSFTGPIGIVRAGRLIEVSFVSVPADGDTVAKIAATFDEDLPMNFEAWLTAKGFVKAELSAEQLAPLQAAFKAEQKGAGNGDGDGDGDGNAPSHVDEVLAAARNRESRHASYGRIIQGAIDRGMETETAERLVEAARNDNLSETDFELRVLRATRHNGTDRVASRSNEASNEVLEAALARSIGDSSLEDHYKPEVLEASERQFRHGISLVELMQLSARRNGHRDISHRDTRALLQAAFAPVQAAGPSTYDVGGVLSNVANKMILAGFNAVEQTWRKISAILPVNDLKAMKSYSLTGDFVYREVPKGGELTHAKMGELEYSNQAKTYGRLFSIDRHDFINDDLGAFQRVRTMLGRGAALQFNLVFWTEFLKNVSTFYTAARANFISGAGSALDIDGLSTGVTTFENQTDADGNPLGLTPALLLTPTALKIQGAKLTADTEYRVNGASSKTTYTTGNPHAGKFEPVASTYLNNSKIPNGSATHWFLLADPMDMPVIQTVFLYGRQQPFIEQASADFNQLGVQLRGYHDFGVTKQEYRGGVRSAGA